MEFLELRVPEWNGYYPIVPRDKKEDKSLIKISIPTNISNSEQIDFFNLFKKNFLNRNYIKNPNIVPYVFALEYHLIADYIEERLSTESIVEYLKAIMSEYGEHASIKGYTQEWLSDIYYSLDNYEYSWNNLGIYTIENVINIKWKLSNKRLTGSELLNFASLDNLIFNRIQKKQISNELLEEIKANIQEEYSDCIEKFLNGIDLWGTKDKFFKQFSNVLCSEKYLESLLVNYHNEIRQDNDNYCGKLFSKDYKLMFKGFPYFEMIGDYKEYKYIKWNTVPRIFKYIISQYYKKIFIDLLNKNFKLKMRYSVTKLSSER
ncbi:MULTISPECIES: hypothetical protein [Clostridium]|uniref:Uncharacterized protein n=1 Tax=Clostridium frigoriphilum TaxID=443253 RepID=A0ABU7USD3_9CLOT|nr:hypothetical protein [Clostridium sp. DSM 17811]MBU3100662.1 hypothetical protein [Clostridium sp. DSM 17811]